MHGRWAGGAGGLAGVVERSTFFSEQGSCPSSTAYDQFIQYMQRATLQACSPIHPSSTKYMLVNAAAACSTYLSSKNTVVAGSAPTMRSASSIACRLGLHTTWGGERHGRGAGLKTELRELQQIEAATRSGHMDLPACPRAAGAPGVAAAQGLPCAPPGPAHRPPVVHHAPLLRRLLHVLEADDALEAVRQAQDLQAALRVPALRARVGAADCRAARTSQDPAHTQSDTHKRCPAQERVAHERSTAATSKPPSASCRTRCCGCSQTHPQTTSFTAPPSHLRAVRVGEHVLGHRNRVQQRAQRGVGLQGERQQRGASCGVLRGEVALRAPRP